MTMDFSDYGAKVTIAAPPSNEVFDATQLAQSGPRQLSPLVRSRRFRVASAGNGAGSVEARWRSFKKIVRLWVDLFDRHNLLTYASAVALRMFIAAVACTLFWLGILGATHERRLWRARRSPHRSSEGSPPRLRRHQPDRCSVSSPRPVPDCSRSPPHWLSGRCQGIIRAAIGALDEDAYETPETAAVLDPLSALVRARDLIYLALDVSYLLVLALAIPAGGLPAADLHRLPRLRARLVPAVQARQRLAGRGARAGRLRPFVQLAPQPRGPSRHGRRPRPARGRRRPHADRRRVPGLAVAAPARRTACSATRS